MKLETSYNLHRIILYISLALVLLSTQHTTCTAFIRKQSVAIKGRLRCGRQPASNVAVRLFDEDEGIDPDDELAVGHTDINGEFEMAGAARETTTLDPRIQIHHRCRGNKIGRCARVWRIIVPEKYITWGEIPTSMFDVGDLNLEVAFGDDAQDNECPEIIKRV